MRRQISYDDGRNTGSGEPASPVCGELQCMSLFVCGATSCQVWALLKTGDCYSGKSFTATKLLPERGRVQEEVLVSSLFFLFSEPVPLWPSISRGIVVTASSTEQTSTRACVSEKWVRGGGGGSVCRRLQTRSVYL